MISGLLTLLMTVNAPTSAPGPRTEHVGCIAVHVPAGYGARKPPVGEGLIVKALEGEGLFMVLPLGEADASLEAGRDAVLARLHASQERWAKVEKRAPKEPGKARAIKLAGRAAIEIESISPVTTPGKPQRDVRQLIDVFRADGHGYHLLLQHDDEDRAFGRSLLKLARGALDLSGCK